MKKYQTVKITKSDRVMKQFKGLVGYVAVIHNDGVEVEFPEPIHKSGQTRLFFRFDQIEK